ncbi:MAG: transporter [Candidatus Brocadiales bacterium]|nr:transporter [Candidatus Brocadiales bacterium]
MKTTVIKYRYITIFIIWMIATVCKNNAYACDLCSLGGFGGTTGAVNPISAESPKKNKYTLGYILEYQDWEAVSIRKAHELHEEGRDAHARKNDISNSVFFGYGITDALSVSLQVPYVERRFKEVHEEEFLGDNEKATGLGDSILLGKYKFYDKQFGLAGIFGLKLPTGTTDERNKAGEKYEPELQPGVGSLDYLFGISANKKINHLIVVDGTVLYHLKTEGDQNYEFGDIVRVTTGATFNVIDGNKKPTLNFLSEVISQFANKDVQDGETIRDSGGTTIFFAPGVSSYLTEQLKTTLSVPVPVYQGLGGEHQELDFNVLFSMSYSF